MSNRRKDAEPGTPKVEEGRGGHTMRRLEKRYVPSRNGNNGKGQAVRLGMRASYPPAVIVTSNRSLDRHAEAPALPAQDLGWKRQAKMGASTRLQVPSPNPIESLGPERGKDRRDRRPANQRAKRHTSAKQPYSVGPSTADAHIYTYIYMQVPTVEYIRQGR